MKSAIITGAYGYVGSLIRAHLEADGWTTTGLVRRPRAGDRAHAWALGQSPERSVLEGIDALVHCAYDFGPRTTRRLWKINVEGSGQLLHAAHAAGVKRLLFVSSMSAYAGTDQAYGRIKLAVEEIVASLGGVSVRPGLVYGDRPAGMAGTLVRIARLPIVPVIAAQSARQFPVHEADLAGAIRRILDDEDWVPETFGIAQRSSVSLRELLEAFAGGGGPRALFLPVPWRAIYWPLCFAEAAHLPLPLRSDSLLGLVRPANEVPRSAAFPDLLTDLRSLA
jgi:nucleoside-diphosphate-sugar epimerase